MGKRILTSVLIVLILFTNLVAYGEIVMPEPTKMFYTNDFADVIDENVEASIISVNLNYEKTAQKPQIVVATVQNMQGLDENSYAAELFEKWKIGNKDYNNGVLILLAIDERRIKIETGYGLEGAIPDSVAGRILDSSTSFLSEGDYSRGIENIFFQVAKEINEEYNFDDNTIFENMNVDIQEQTSNQNQVQVYSLIKPILIIILLLILGGFGGGPGRRRRRGFYIPPSIFRGGGGFGGGSFGGGGRSGGGGAGRGF